MNVSANRLIAGYCKHMSFERNFYRVRNSSCGTQLDELQSIERGFPSKSHQRDSANWQSQLKVSLVNF